MQSCTINRTASESEVKTKRTKKNNLHFNSGKALVFFYAYTNFCSLFAMWNSMWNVNTSQLETCWKQNNRKIIRIMQTYKRIIGLPISLCPCGIFVTIIHVAVWQNGLRTCVCMSLFCVYVTNVEWCALGKVMYGKLFFLFFSLFSFPCHYCHII